MLDRSEYENLVAAAKKFYVPERKESKLQKALDATLKMISELKAKGRRTDHRVGRVQVYSWSASHSGLGEGE